MFTLRTVCPRTAGARLSPQNALLIPPNRAGFGDADVRGSRLVHWLGVVVLAWQTLLPLPGTAAEPADVGLLAQDNLVAWCIVPFDATKRTPEQRAEMLSRLGLRKVAYDWREEHVASFEEEILAYKRHGIEYFAFWDEHPAAFALFAKHQLHPQIWKMIPQQPDTPSAEKRIAAAGQALLPLAKTTRDLQFKLGLYNHGGWAGQPETLATVCEWLREHTKSDHVGIVYNFHHGHEHIADFDKSLRRMLPYLLCVNINGMNAAEQPKILGVGQGDHEREMLRIVVASGYRGPIGILDHREQLDTEVSLRENLDGVARIRAEWQTP